MAETHKKVEDKYSRIPDGESVKGSFLKGQADSLAVAGGAISFSGGTLLRDTELSVSVLAENDMPELDFAMTNVTAQGEGYRFLPHGTHFSDEGATVRLGYDRTRIPSGYTEDDIRTFYYDTEQEHWVALDRIAVNKELAYVESKTTHFTDMINGVIQAPESPETDGFAPTMMNDIKAADPTAKLNIITPPSANNRGSANLQYAFEMPPARNGMSPSLGISYNSDGGNGWLGQGWDLSVPSITLDTRWGVPRYDLENETETYLLSGSMLSTMDDNGAMSVAHRGDKIARKSDRQFYTRQGGDFSRIIRKGDSPADYYWEVTDKQGVIYTYGGEGAVLKGTITDLSGNTREVISEWRLRRVEETHGDWIEYEYETVDEPVRGGLVAKSIYLSKVTAGNAEGNGPHTVVTLTGNKSKRQKTNNARYGYLTSSYRLLEKVQIEFMGEELRSYAFSYVDGAFHKDMLESVRQFDDKGTEFAFQKFDYYDDVQSGNGYVPFLSESEAWNTHNDGLDAGFINPLQGTGRFSDKPTALGGTTSTSTSGSFYLGVGVADGSQWKGNTVGGSYNYSKDTSKGLSTLVDLNGDGLPDKVYRKNGALYYRPQIRDNGSGQISYGEAIKINGISNFSTTKSSTNSGGAKAVVGWQALTGVLGVDVAKTKTQTTEYFSDINGDGLMDFVSNSKVYFNHIEFDSQGNAIPTFTLSSGDTPSPIIYDASMIDKSVTEVDPDEQKEIIASSPMEDMVRVWVAPKSGTVNISGTVSLIVPTGDYDTQEYEKADGVRVAIQKGGSELWSQSIAKGDATVHNASATAVSVNKGDRIYFRVQSGNEETSNGAFDNVAWSPETTYTGTEEILPNGLSNVTYKPQDGAIYDVNTVVNVDEGNPFSIAGHFSKPRTTDDVVIKVIASNERYDDNGNLNPNFVEKEVYRAEYGWQDVVDSDINADIPNEEKLPNVSFIISSSSNVDWPSIKWTPEVSYNDSIGVSRNISVAPHYQTYAQMDADCSSKTFLSQDTVIHVKPAITFSSADINGMITLLAKTQDKLIAKKSFAVANGVIAPDSLTIKNIGTEKVWFEYAYPATLSSEVIASSVSVRRGNTIIPESITAGFYSYGQDEGFGMLYRGWGGFTYNASEGRYARPIDESLLKLPEDKDAQIDPLTYPFTPIGTDQMSLNRWVGQHTDIYLTADEAGSARLVEQDVVLTNPLDNIGDIAGMSGEKLQGTGAAAFTQISTNNSTSTMGGAMGVTYSDANGNAKTEVMMMDMNGDGYPDLIAGGIIQYTNSQGGLSGEKLSDIGTIKSKSDSYAWGLGGDPVHSVSNIVQMVKSVQKSDGTTTTTTTSQPESSATNDAQNSKISVELSKVNPSFSISGSVPHNTDEAQELFLDVNGDGLPDKIVGKNSVRINLGYSFTEPIDMGLSNGIHDGIQGGKTLSYSVGAGGGAGVEAAIKSTRIDKASGSFSVGANIVSSESEEEYSFMDVNSDGLADKVWKTESGIMVALNVGNGFDSPFLWSGLGAINESVSTSESVNAAFTVSINIPVIQVKISTNPGFSTGHSISRPKYSLQDVDGDGYLDVVTSDKENELNVTRSAIGRTNMLRSVTNSIGGRFEMDYAHSTPTYGHPGGKWVMSELTIDDGIHDDGPLMKSAFEYSDGFRDRHERDFLGFGKVVTKSLDTNSGNSIYRQAVQEFAVDNYYASGNLIASYITDASGNKFTETVNEYDAYSMTANADNYSFVKKDVIYSDRASAFVPLRYTANKQYEGESQGMVISEAWNEYYLNGNHGELKSYRYSDKGNLGNNGAGGYDYATNIQYTSNSGKHIFGLPTNVTVVGGDGSMYHNVSATYDTKYPNHLTQVSQQLGSGVAVTDYKYDRYGNITQKTLPANGTGQRMWYKYRYEPEMNMYVERIDDAWGYRSEAGNFDYRYGIALERRDLNNFYYETEIDNLGRVTKVRGPNELATGVPYIIAFEYKPKAVFAESGISAPAYAVTKHYDIQHPGDDLETVTFVDGFGRPVQVKKDGVVTTASKGSGASDQNVMIVSGRNVYDAFGRVTKAFYPTTERMGSKTSFNTTFDNVNPTITAYDVLDRALEITLPDGAKTETKYLLDMGSNALVTRVKDALGNEQSTYANGSGKTIKSVQHSGPEGDITTSFEYDGIQRLVKVTDVEGNVTTSVYDMGDRRTEVNHPASGITSFTYDPLGNVLTKQTANMAEEGKMITYTYDYHRLTGISYPDHPENNVKYYYGGRNASHNRIGRLMMREDGTGAIEYFYGKMGEVTKTRRTLIVPNQAIATYVTQWTYDSHYRLIEMNYPDEEKVIYSYNLGGLLEKVRGEKSYGYDYITKLGYDKFEQRSYLKYCNGAETFYTYDDRRRLSNLAVNSGGTSIMDNDYTFDAVSNVLSVANNASLPANGKAGGQMSHTYTYDGFYRLATATGTYTGADNKL
ncbi:MAG: type IV secretion protein Rhs [Muribaculaceae bacterium]|nr:type IV secretion protein Rhs [Muribaculaceae bacterium]